MFLPHFPLPLRSWVAGLLLVAAAVPAAAADIPWLSRAWQADEGLPDNTVVGVAQTPDGFLWVGTQSGLARFDGVRFTEYAPAVAAGVPTSLIQALLLDRRGRLWFAKGRGVLACLDGERLTALTTADGLPDLQAMVLAEDRAGAIWISSAGGRVFGLHDGQIRAFGVEDGLSVA